MAVNSHFTVLLIPVFVSECLNVISVPIYVDTEKRGGTQGWREKREQGVVSGDKTLHCALGIRPSPGYPTVRAPSKGSSKNKTWRD